MLSKPRTQDSQHPRDAYAKFKVPGFVVLSTCFRTEGVNAALGLSVADHLIAL